MKLNTRLLRCPLGRPKAVYTLCTLNTSWHSAMKAKAHSSLAMLQECLCNSWGDPSATPSYEHRKEVRYTFYFQIEKKKPILYSSSSKHEVTFLKAMLNSVVNTWEESSRTFIWTWSSFSQGPDALQSCPLWPHMETSSLYFVTYSSLKSLKEKLKLTKCLEK